MLLRTRLMMVPETIQDFELASEQKYWEGLELMAAGHRSAGIYLMGYAAEMWLKSACFRFDGAHPGDYIKSRLESAGRLGKSLSVGFSDNENYHSLLFWGSLLHYKRNNAPKPFDAGFEAQLSYRFLRLYAIWWIEMRYRPDQAMSVEVNEVFEHVSWFRKNYGLLWR